MHDLRHIRATHGRWRELPRVRRHPRVFTSHCLSTSSYPRASCARAREEYDLSSLSPARCRCNRPLCFTTKPSSSWERSRVPPERVSTRVERSLTSGLDDDPTPLSMVNAPAATFEPVSSARRPDRMTRNRPKRLSSTSRVVSRRFLDASWWPGG